MTGCRRRLGTSLARHVSVPHHEPVPVSRAWRSASRRATSVAACLLLVVLGNGVLDVASAGETGGISGLVTDAAQHLPVSGLCVASVASTLGYPRTRTTTDSTGSYTISGLEPGDYWVNFGECATDWAMQYYPNSYSADEDYYTKVHVDAGRTTPGINAQMEHYGTITGRVTWRSDGTPVAGTCVDVIQTDRGGGGFLRPVGTDADGRFTVPEVTPNDWFVIAADLCGPYSPDAAPTAYQVDGRRGTATIVHVADGESVRGIDEAVPRGAHVTGRVVDQDGHPVSGLMFNLFPSYVEGRHDFATPTTGGYTNARGRYRLNQLATGDYNLQFGKPWGRVRWYRNSKTLQDAAAFRLHVDDTRHLRVQTWHRRR